MFRKTLTILSLIGLLLSVGLWVIPYSFGFRWGSISAGVSSGVLELSHWSDQQVWQVWGDWQEWGFITVRPYRGTYHTIFGQSVPFVAVPLWMPAVAFGLVWLIFLSPFHRRRKRKKLGLCIKCGYDLRASEERCPECGRRF